MHWFSTWVWIIVATAHSRSLFKFLCWCSLFQGYDSLISSRKESRYILYNQQNRSFLVHILDITILLYTLYTRYNNCIPSILLCESYKQIRMPHTRSKDCDSSIRIACNGLDIFLNISLYALIYMQSKVLCSKIYSKTLQ